MNETMSTVAREASLRYLLLYLRLTGLTSLSLVDRSINDKNRKTNGGPFLCETYVWQIYKWFIVLSFSVLIAILTFQGLLGLWGYTGISVILRYASLIFYSATVYTIYASLTFRRKSVQSILEISLQLSLKLEPSFWWKFSIFVGIHMLKNLCGFLIDVSHTVFLKGGPDSFIHKLVRGSYYGWYTVVIGGVPILNSGIHLILTESFKRINNQIQENPERANVVKHIIEHSKVWEVCQELNSTFGLSNLSLLTISLVECFQALNELIKNSPEVIFIIWGAFGFCSFCMTLIPPEMTADEAKTSGWIMSNISLEQEDYISEKEIQDFYLRYHHQEFVFDANGMFKLNKNLITSIFGTLATYGFILKQFQDVKPQ